MGVISGAANLYFIYRFLRILTTAWEDSDAFKLGIIDEKGKILKKKSKLRGKEEKEAYTMMHRFVWKLKRLLEKIPFGKSRMASYAAALWLIKEEKDFHGTDAELQESFLSFLETDWKDDALILKENYEGDMNKKTYNNLKEGFKDLPPHLQKSLKQYAKKQKRLEKEYGLKVKTFAYNPKTGKPDIEIEEKAPPGWEGTVKAMKKKKGIDNPYSLAWYMKNKGDKSHIPEEVEEGWKKGKYKVTDGKTGKVLGKFNSGSKAQKYVDDIFQKGDYESLTVELDEKVVYARGVELDEVYGLVKIGKRVNPRIPQHSPGQLIHVASKKQVEKMLKKLKKLGGDGYIMQGVTMKVGDKVKGVKEEVEIEEASKSDIQSFGKKLSAYAKKSGGIDKDDFKFIAKEATGGHLPNPKSLSRMDTEPREVVLDLMAKEFGRKFVEKEYKTRFTNPKNYKEEVELSESQELQAKMALDDAGIKYSTKNNSITVKKRDLKKAQKAFEKSFKKGGWPTLKTESTKEYAKSLEKIANDKKMSMLSRSEKRTLLKIADMLAKEKKEGVEEHKGTEPHKHPHEEDEIEEDRGDDEHKALVQFKAKFLMRQALKSGKRQSRDWWKKQARIAGLGKLSPDEAMMAIQDAKKEEFEIDEAVLVDRDYKYDGKVIKISRKNFRKVHRDFKGTTKGQETMITYDSKDGTVLVPVEFTEEVKDMAGEWGTDKLTNTLKNDTPGQEIAEKTVCPKCDGEGCDHCDGKGYHTEAKEREISHKEYLKYGGGKDGKQWTSGKGRNLKYWTHRKEEVEWSVPTFSKFITEGRPAGVIRGLGNTATDKERQKLVDSQEKKYTLKDIESIARKHKVRLSPAEVPMKFGHEWTIKTDKGVSLIYDERRNDTQVTGWRIDKKKLREYKDKYEPEDTRIQDVVAGIGRGRLSLRGFESAFEVIGEQLLMTEEGEGGIPANATGTAVVGTGDDPTVWKKKKRKNAKVETEEFGGKKVFVVSPERYWDSRMGKSRYNRYEKYVGNDKLGEAIRLYGRTNPKAPIILKNSENGAMLYLKYGK